VTGRVYYKKKATTRKGDNYSKLNSDISNPNHIYKIGEEGTAGDIEIYNILRNWSKDQ